MRSSKTDGKGRRLKDSAQRAASADSLGHAGGTTSSTQTATENLTGGSKPSSVPPRVGLETALFFLAIFAIYLVSPVISSGDSHFVLPTALSIVRHGDANIDEYSSQFSDARWAVWNQNGHWWNVYPIGVPFLVVPMVWTADRVAAVFGIDLEASARRRPPLLLELAFASLITAAAAALLFYYIRGRLPLGKSILLAGLFALGTSAYSSASRGLWQHGPSMLLLIGAILIYERLPVWGTRAAVLLGMITGYSYAVRPANMAVIAGFAFLLALTAWRRLGPYLCGVVLGVTPLYAFQLTAYGSWSSLYYRITQSGLLALSLPLKPLAGILVSPSRGLFVFSPFLLFLFLRCWPSYLRRYRPTPLEMLLIGLSLAWCIGAARFFMWWGGGSYGPRVLCDLLPFATILLIPVVKELSLSGGRASRVLTVLFLVAGALSIAIHACGATSEAGGEWNATPAGGEEIPERVWSWEDPQFLRGLHNVVRKPERFVRPGGATPLAFYAIVPCRLLDTRLARGVFGGPGLIAGTGRKVPVPDGSCGIPHGAAAYSMNLLAIPRGPLGWLNAWATGEPMPVVSVLNAPTGVATANAAIIRAGYDGSITLLAPDVTDLVIDINGYFAPVEK